MFTLPKHLAAKLSPEVATYIPTFVPQRLLIEQQWARCCEPVWTSCAATLPPSREDAKTQMSITCAFLAFTDKVVGSVDLTTVLTEDLVQRFLINSEGQVSHKTRQNRRGQLGRALKAAAGDAPRGMHGERSAGPQPYTPAELDNLAAAAFSCGPLAAALARGLGAGLVVPAVVGTPPAAPDMIRAVTDALRMDDRWIVLVAPGEFSRDEWAAARAGAEAAGVTLAAARLRATWVAAQLSAPRPVAEIAHAFGLTRADLDNAAGYLPQVDPDQTRQLLRS
ncbi:MAG: hypothetical protein JWO60_2480 [Frankiales bacterium]|nr:hypothetical protein [Frankiales bacterium]